MGFVDKVQGWAGTPADWIPLASEVMGGAAGVGLGGPVGGLWGAAGGRALGEYLQSRYGSQEVSPVDRATNIATAGLGGVFAGFSRLAHNKPISNALIPEVIPPASTQQISYIPETIDITPPPQQSLQGFHRLQLEDNYIPTDETPLSTMLQQEFGEYVSPHVTPYPVNGIGFGSPTLKAAMASGHMDEEMVKHTWDVISRIFPDQARMVDRLELSAPQRFDVLGSYSPVTKRMAITPGLVNQLGPSDYVHHGFANLINTLSHEFEHAGQAKEGILTPEIIQAVNAGGPESEAWKLIETPAYARGNAAQTGFLAKLAALPKAERDFILPSDFSKSILRSELRRLGETELAKTIK